MRRIYESDALKRDDEGSFTPKELDDDAKPQAFRSINGAAWSDHFLPHTLRLWAVSFDVSVPRREFREGETVPFRVTIANALPMPVSIETSSPLLWTWSIDGYQEAAHISVSDPPAEPDKLRLDRGETVRFTREWSQMFRVTEREWEQADPGEHTLRAEINLNTDRVEIGDETTIEIVP
jgi:hypothetical protein